MRKCPDRWKAALPVDPSVAACYKTACTPSWAHTFRPFSRLVGSSIQDHIDWSYACQFFLGLSSAVNDYQ